MFVGTLQGIEMLLGTAALLVSLTSMQMPFNFNQSFFSFVQSLNGYGISTLKVHQWMLLNMNL